MKNSVLCQVAFWLIIIGAINWGLVGIGNFMSSDYDLVALLLGSMPTVQNIVYVLVGLAGLYKLLACGKGCCGSSGGGM